MVLRAESLHANDEEKLEAYENISNTINIWMQEAINASQEGQSYALSQSIRITHLIDCLINGLSGTVQDPTYHAMIVTWTQDNLCSLIQLTPDAFDIPSIG